MKIKTPLIATAATLAATLALSAGAQTSMPAESMESAPKDTAATWSTLDTDKDGALTKKEAAPDKTISKNFKSMDTNKDGKLDQMELAAMDAVTTPATTPKSSNY